MADDKKEKKDKESPQSWWGLGTLAMVLILSISAYLLWPAKKPQRLVSAQPAVVKEKTCPEDPSKCPICEGAKNVYIMPNKKEIVKFSETEITASPNCWSGYIVIIRKEKRHAHPFFSELGWQQVENNGPIFKAGPGVAPEKEKSYSDGIKWRFMAMEKPTTVKVRIASQREKLYENIN